MKKILFVNLPMQSHIIPTLGIVKELVKLGYEVSYINTLRFKDLIEASGARLVPYKNSPNARKNTDLLMYKASYDTAMDIVQEYDVILYEMCDFLGQMIAINSHKPAVRLCSQFVYNEELKNKLIYSNKKYLFFRQKLWAKIWTNLFFSGNVPYRYNDYFDELVHNYPELNIVFTSKTFQYFSDEFDDSFKFVGPINTKRPNKNTMIPFEKMTKPIIYVSIGTLASSKKFAKKCIKAFIHKDVDVIFSLGNKTKMEEIGTLPENFYAYQWVPQLEVLQKSSLFISHAGMNSVNESLYFGVPLLISPISNDQFIIADRVEELNLGVRFHLDKISPEELWDVTITTLQNDSILHECQKMSTEMRDAGGVLKAVEYIDEYCSASIRQRDKEIL